MKALGILGLVGVLTACATGAASEVTERPNIVLIITDDQGYGDLGFHGNPAIQTPTLDSLAQRSTRFPYFYVSPVCAPTRSSLMTGRYSLRTGIYDTYNGGATMATEEVTVAEVLQDAGYATGIFGKWHLGDTYPFRPQDQGFDEAMIHPSGGMGQVGDVYNYFAYDSSYFDPTVLHNGTPVATQGYVSDVFTDGALDFVEAHQDEPFFLYLSFNAPHTPLQLPEDAYEPYRDLTLDAALYPADRPYPAMRPRDGEAARKVYGMVTNIDTNIRRLWDQLERFRLTDNTLLVFMTDNGPQQVRYTGGLRGRKGTVYEGGIRVPFFMHWPGYLPENYEVPIYAAHLDVLPTLLDIAGIEASLPHAIDGHNLMPAIRGEAVAWAERPLFFYWQRDLPEPYRNIAVREGVYKLVGQTGHNASVEDFELFNISADPYEQTNVVAEQPEVAARLKGLFNAWYAEAIESPHLRPQPHILGSAYEDPVILNRNDAKGTRGIWAQRQIYAYWDVAVATTTSYNLTFRFEHPVPGGGHMMVRVGNAQRTVNIPDSTDLIVMRAVQLVEGEHRFESWYQHQGPAYLPFYVEVRRSSDSGQGVE